jgi:hypothetical protein
MHIVRLSLPMLYRRQIVQTLPNDSAGTILIDTENKFLYYLLPQGKAIRYGIIVGEPGQAWSGTARIGRNGQRGPRLPANGKGLATCQPSCPAVRANPMGSRGMCLFSGDKGNGGANILRLISAVDAVQRVWQIGHQLPVARCPAGIARGLLRQRSPAAQRHGGDCEC